MSALLDPRLERAISVAAKVIMSPVQAEEWEVLREGLGDPELLAVKAFTYRRNMQLVAAQLLKGAVAQAIGSPALLMSDPMAGLEKILRVRQLVSEQVNDVEPVVQEYNRAYGDTTGQWASRMVHAFEVHACSETLRSPTVDVMARYLQALLISHREKFVRVVLGA